jgi:hypothetical protein
VPLPIIIVLLMLLRMPTGRCHCLKTLKSFITTTIAIVHCHRRCHCPLNCHYPPSSLLSTIFVTVTSPPACHCPLPPQSNAIVVLCCHHGAGHQLTPSNADIHPRLSLLLSLVLLATIAANHQPLPSEGIIANHCPLMLNPVDG